jgi:hypothetical protein
MGLGGEHDFACAGAGTMRAGAGEVQENDGNMAPPILSLLSIPVRAQRVHN